MTTGRPADLLDKSPGGCHPAHPSFRCASDWTVAESNRMPLDESTPPWKRARIRVAAPGHPTVVEVLPRRVAVRWASGQRDRLRDALREISGRDPGALDGERLLVLAFDRTPGKPFWEQLARLRDQGLFDWASPTLRDVESGLELVPTDEIVVRVDEGVTEESLRRLASPRGLSIAAASEFAANQYVVKADRPVGLEVLDHARALAALPGVRFAVPDFLTASAR